MPTSAPQHHRWTDLSPAGADRVDPAPLLHRGSVHRRAVRAQEGWRRAAARQRAGQLCPDRRRFGFSSTIATVVVGAGEVMQIPGGIAHEVAVLEDTLVLDIFSPVRQDWIDGTDTYFTRKDLECAFTPKGEVRSMSATAAFLQEFEQEAKTTRRVLERVPTTSSRGSRIPNRCRSASWRCTRREPRRDRGLVRAGGDQLHRREAAGADVDR